MMDEFTIRRLEAILNGYFEAKVPKEVRSFVRLKYVWDGKAMILFEERSHSHGRQWLSSAIAQFRLEHNQWNVYALNASHDWVPVKSIAPSPDFERQLEQVELDPEGIFWPTGDWAETF